MLSKDDLEEIYEIFKLKHNTKRIEKAVNKADPYDYTIFLRTKQNSFLAGATRTGFHEQLADLIETAAENIGTTPRNLLKEIEVTIYNKEALRIEIEQIIDQREELEDEEYQEKLKKAFENHKVDERTFNTIIRQYNL